MRTFSARSQYARLPTDVEDEVYKHEELRPQFSDEEVPETGKLPSHTSGWHFVECSWFQALTAIVIFGNSVTTFLMVAHPHIAEWVSFIEHGMLCFYLFEITARICAFRRAYLCDTFSHVVWNVLDILVVVAGVVDQWLMPLLSLPEDSLGRTVLHMLRMLRLLRVLKIVRVFLDSDMSWTETPAFQSFIGFLIVVNSAIMGLEVDVPWEGWLIMEHLLLCVYVFELAVRLKHLGIEFYRPRNPDIVWNMLDSLIVGSSVADSWIAPLYGLVTEAVFGDNDGGKAGGGMTVSKLMMLMRMLRLFRILRLVKLVKAVRPLFMLVTSIVSAFQGVVWVLVLTIITLYGMAIISTDLIGNKMAFAADMDIPDELVEPFRSVPESMFTLFRLMSSDTSDEESNAIDAVLQGLPTLKFAFVFFMITCSWTLLSILTAVVSENMLTSTSEQHLAMKLQCEEEDRALHVLKLSELFDSIDHGGVGIVAQSDVDEFLSDREHRLRASKDVGIPIHCVREVLDTLSSATDTGTISKENFVEYLIDAANSATEKSMMKLEFYVKNLFDELNSKLAEVNDRVQELQTHELITHGAGLHEHSNKGSGHVEHPFEHRIQAYDKYNQQLLAKTQEAQQKHIDFLQSLERRWQGLEDLSLGLAVERLACALNGVEPLRNDGDLRFNYGTPQHDYVDGHPLPRSAAQQERTSGQAVQAHGRHPPRERPRQASLDRRKQTMNSSQQPVSSIMSTNMETSLSKHFAHNSRQD